MVDSVKAYHGDNFDKWILDNAPLGIISTSEVVEQIRFLLDKKGTKSTGGAYLINGGSQI